MLGSLQVQAKARALMRLFAKSERHDDNMMSADRVLSQAHIQSCSGAQEGMDS